MLQKHTEKNSAVAPSFRKVFFKNGRDGRFWALDYNQQTHEMRNVQVDWRRADGSTLVFAAERGVRTNGLWDFYNVREQTEVAGNIFPVNRILTNEAVPEFTETPEAIKSEIQISDRLNNWQKDRAEVRFWKLSTTSTSIPTWKGVTRIGFTPNFMAGWPRRGLVWWWC